MIVLVVESVWVFVSVIFFMKKTFFKFQDLLRVMMSRVSRVWPCSCPSRPLVLQIRRYFFSKDGAYPMFGGRHEAENESPTTEQQE
jgi:hypothetical protein